MCMTGCKNIEYKGKCIVDGHSYSFSRAVPEDVGGISLIYEQTRIDKSNYRDKLSDTSPRRFEEKGGMFVVLTEKEIGEEIEKDSNFWIVFRDEDGAPAGSFWFSERNDSYRGLSYEHMEKCIYPREVAVSKSHGGRSIAQLMYYTCSVAFLRAGYERGCADLYRVIGYRTDEGSFTTDQINIPSRMSVLAIGAEFAEPLPVRDIELDGLTVTIEPQMYLFDYKKISEKCGKELSEKDIRIIWE